MISRYTPKEIGEIWSEEEKFKRFLKIEVLLCEALESFKKIPSGTAKRIARVRLSLEEIKKIEETTHHDIVAFLEFVSSQIGEAARFLHIGLTSSDLLDTTLAWQIKDATRIILKDLEKLIRAVKRQALKHRNTLCVARTHGVHAEIYSFGLKFLYFYNDLLKEKELLKASLDYVACGKISGAVGTFVHLEPRIEEYICRKIGINWSAISTQIVSRERVAYYLSLLALIASSLERFATEIRHLGRTEVGEAQEPFYKGQKGSSAMPHKQNPILCERLCGLARVLRANMLVGFENINLWHERDISHSSAERIILPDSTILVDYMLKKMHQIIEDLETDPQRMLKNIELSKGLIYSQKVLLALMEKGLTRPQAYQMVQDISLKAIEKDSDFLKEILEDARIKKFLSKEEIEDIFNPHLYLKNIHAIYKRFGL